MKKLFFSVAAALMLGTSAFAAIEKSNELTASHKKFDNYTYAIVPPAGFEMAKIGTGFLSADKKQSIFIQHQNEVLDASSTNDVLKLVYENWTKKFDKVESVYINDTEYYLATKEETDSQTKVKKTVLTLAIPEDRGSVTLTAACPAGDAEALVALQEALLSVVYVDNADSPVFENSLYSIENQGFKPVAEGSTLVTFCESGDLAKELATGRVVNFKILMNKEKPADITKKKQPSFAKGVVNALKDDDESIASEKEITIDGLPGFEYEMVQEGASGVIAKSYIVVLFSSNAYYCFQSKANKEIDTFMPKFKAAAQSFKLKK